MALKGKILVAVEDSKVLSLKKIMSPDLALECNISSYSFICYCDLVYFYLTDYHCTAYNICSLLFLKRFTNSRVFSFHPWVNMCTQGSLSIYLKIVIYVIDNMQT